MTNEQIHSRFTAIRRGIIGAADTAEARLEALALLRRGDAVALPTETVYGLAADATRADAVARIFDIKGRPSFNPLICHVANLEMAQKYAQFGPLATRLAGAFWPGPLTLVLPCRANTNLAPAVTAGLPNIGLRCPNHSLMRDLIGKLERPLAAPSANPSGKLSPTNANDLAALYGQTCPPILDGGPTSVGIESTIVHVIETPATIMMLRPGTITSSEIEAHTGVKVSERSDTKITAPGQLESHYAPDLPVLLNVTAPAPSQIHISFGNADGDFNLSPTGDLAEAAQRLYATLALADAKGQRVQAEAISVGSIPSEGIGRALNDRLARAAAPRPNPAEVLA